MVAAARMILVTLALGATPATAQTGQQPSDRQLLGMAIENLARTRCGERPCAPATAQERARPPITDEQARMIISSAAVSVMAEHCGLDWQRRNFLPLMAHHRQGLRMNERQLAIVGLLHGIAMRVFGDAARRRPCTPGVKEGVVKRLLVPG